MPSPDQLRILIVISFVLLFLFGLKRPVYAVSAYMILVYCKVSYYYPFFTLIRAESLFALLVLLRVVSSGNFLKNVSISVSAINKYVFILVCCIMLSFVVAWDHQYSWDMAIYHFLKTLVLYVLILGAIETKNDLKIFVWSFMLMYLYLAYEPMYSFLTGTGGSQQMYGTNFIGDSGLLAGHVALANNMNQMLPLAWFLYWGSGNRLARVGSAVCFLVFLLALVGSGSRGGLVGMAVWGVLIVWFAKGRVKIAMIMLPILFVAFFAIGSYVMHTASRINKSSIGARMTGLTHGIGMLRKGNLIGVGPGCYRFARRKYFSYRMESHNIYGQIIGDLGLPGMLATFLLMRQVFRTIISVKRRAEELGEQGKFILYLMTGVQVSIITRLVVSMASHGLYFFYWYVMAALVIISQRLLDDSNSPNPPPLLPIRKNEPIE